MTPNTTAKQQQLRYTGAGDALTHHGTNGYRYEYGQGYANPYHMQHVMASGALAYPHMHDSVPSISSAFRQKFLKYEIPHSAMIPKISKYNRTTDPDEHINTYEWTMTSLWMDKRFTYN